MKSIQTFLKKFNRISFRETPKVLSLAWEKFFEIKHAFKEKQHQPEDIQELLRKLLKDLQIISEELAEYINSPSWNCPAFYDDDDEYTIQYMEYLENSSNAITPDLPIEEPDNSLNPHHFNAESDLIESLLNRDTSIVSSPKFDSLLKEFSGELAHINLISPEIDEADFDPEEEIRLVEKLLYDNSSPRPPEELNFENSDAVIESFSPSPIPVEDSDSLMEEIDLFLTPDDSMPPGIENDDYDSEGDILFLEELLNNDSLSLPENESFQFDRYYDPSSPRPPAKPPDDDDVYFDIEPDTGVFTKVVDGISDNSTRELYVHVPNVLPTLPTLSPMFDTLLPFSSENYDKVFNPGILASNEEKSPNLLSHRGFKAFQVIFDFSESPMMIYGEDIPLLDVLIAPDFEDSRARGFVHRPLDLQAFACLYMGIRYPRSY
ncbi:hypothetical protein Tco_0674022 [Tanacetum coccineum]